MGVHTLESLTGNGYLPWKQTGSLDDARSENLYTLCLWQHLHGQQVT